MKEKSEKPTTLVVPKGFDVDLWRTRATGYFETRAATIDEAAHLIDTMRLPPLYSYFFLSDIGVDRPEPDHRTWLTMQDAAYKGIATSVVSTLRRENMLCRHGVEGEHGDLWLKDFAVNFPAPLTEARLQKMARKDVLDEMGEEIMNFDEDIGPSVLLPKNAEILVQVAGETRLDHNTLQHLAIHNAGLMAIEILFAMHRHGAEDIRAGFHVWADSLTKEDYECFEARRMPFYLSLAVPCREPA